MRINPIEAKIILSKDIAFPHTRHCEARSAVAMTSLLAENLEKAFNTYFS